MIELSSRLCSTDLSLRLLGLFGLPFSLLAALTFAACLALSRQAHADVQMLV